MTLRPAILVAALVAVVLQLSSVAAWPAVVAGKVTAEGQPLAEAWVQLNTGLTTRTDARGRFSFGPVPKATYALQVFGLGKEPLAVGDVVAGTGATAVDLANADTPVGLVHVKATRADRGSPRPARIVTRWRAEATDEFGPPPALEGASTLDGRGKPLIPAESVRPFIVPFGACLWCQGEAVIALRPGEAELTCTSGPLVRVSEQTVPVRANEVTEVEVSMAAGAALGELGWVGGRPNLRVSSPQGQYLTNLPLAVAIARAEGLGWMVVAPGYGSDPAQAEPRQVAREMTTEEFHVWLSPEGRREPWGGTMVTIGQSDGSGEAGTAPHHRQASRLKQSVSIYAHALRTGVEEPSDSAGRPAWRDLAAELPFDLLADPAAVPALDLQLTSPQSSDYFRLWALLLNHGYQVGALSFTNTCIDTGVLPVAERVFVHASFDRGIIGLVDGIRRGATFVSSGPVVSLAVADAMPGETVPADDQTKIGELDAWLGCVPGGGISRLELLRAGQVVRTWDIAEVGPNHVETRIAIRERERTWFALRAYGAAPEGVATPHVACTSPVYFRPPDAAAPRPLLARIFGQVLDGQTGEPVANARVTATSPSGRPVVVSTGGDGAYELTAPAGTMVEVTHPRYQRVDRVMTGDGGPREDNTTKFVAWDCREVFSLLRFASPEDLLDWQHYDRLATAMATPRLDFSLTPRR